MILKIILCLKKNLYILYFSTSGGVEQVKIVIMGILLYLAIIN